MQAYLPINGAELLKEHEVKVSTCKINANRVHLFSKKGDSFCSALNLTPRPIQWKIVTLDARRTDGTPIQVKFPPLGYNPHKMTYVLRDENARILLRVKIHTIALDKGTLVTVPTERQIRKLEKDVALGEDRVKAMMLLVGPTELTSCWY